MTSTVWYIGKGRRIISSHAWSDYNITAPDTVWEAENGWAVPTASLTNDQLAVLATMRDQFYLNQNGPRTWPAPNEIVDYQDSAFIYYARIKEFYDELTNAQTGPVGPQGPAGPQGLPGPGGQRGTVWFTGSGAPGVIAQALPGDKYVDLDNGSVYTFS
jgi:hypothetical protein